MKHSIVFLGLLMLSMLLSSCSITSVSNPSASLPAVSGPLTSGSSLQANSDVMQTSPQTAAGFYYLITEPVDGITPVLSLIQKASKSLDLVMYELEDSQIEKALVSAESRGVAVRVLLNHGYYTQPSKTNDAAYQYLQSQGVDTRWTPSYFALTHQKTLISDGNRALIMTSNFTPQYYSTDRDFGVIDKDPRDVAAIETAFNDDWQSTKDKPSAADDLVWSPGAEAALLALINNSHTSLLVENEEMADSDVENALISAAQRGVTVEVVMTYSSQWATDFRKLTAGGVKIRTYAANASLYIHAKFILADNANAFIGSQNFSATSLKDNRELGILLNDPGILNSGGETFQKDWNGGTNQ